MGPTRPQFEKSGQFAQALNAYNSAIALNSRDYDIHLCRGHLLKLMGRRDGAIEAYRTSLECRVEGNDALNELIAMGATEHLSSLVDPSILPGKVKYIYLDIADLMEYVKHNLSLSGIQRVAAGLIKNINKVNSSREGILVLPVISDFKHLRVCSVSAILVAAMIDRLRTEGCSRDTLDKAIRAIYNSRKLIEPTSGDCFVIAGAFWIYPHYDLIKNLRQRGVTFCLFIHDLIQINNPEYVEKGVGPVFRRALVDSLVLANFVLTNSEYVAQDVRTFMRTRLNFEIPAVAVPLATELQPTSCADAKIGPEVVEIAKSEYVLCVSTIEIRKNHMYMIKIWERLIKDYDGKIPNLVFVGKIGWQVDQLFSHLAASDYLGGRLYIFNSISDAALSHLYENCLFTMFPSFAEGFGLPVGESLAYGKPCLVSNRSSMPEVGGNLARYFDPDDVSQGYRVVRALLSDREDLRLWTDMVRQEHKPKSWATFASEFVDVVIASHSTENSGSVNCVLEPNEIVGIGSDESLIRDRKGRKLLTVAAARIVGWHPTEPWGCWSSARRSMLKFYTRLVGGTKVIVYLSLKLPAGTRDATCRITIGGIDTMILDLTETPAWVPAKGLVDPDGSLTISFLSGGGFSHPESRDLYVGIRSLGYYEKDNLAARVSLLEEIIFEDLNHPQLSLSRFRH